MKNYLLNGSKGRVLMCQNIPEFRNKYIDYPTCNKRKILKMIVFSSKK